MVDLVTLVTRLAMKLINFFYRCSRPMEATLDGKNILTIPYVFKGTYYTVRLPLIRRTRQIFVTGVKEDGSTIDLTQQAGVSYHITPDDLDLQQIIIDTGLRQTQITGTQMITF